MKVYNPEIHVNVFNDWFRDGSTQLEPTDDLQQVLAEPYRIAFLAVFFDQYKAVDVSQFDLVVLSDIEFAAQDRIEAWAERIGIKQYLLAVGGFMTAPSADNVIYRPWWMFNLMQNNQWVDVGINQQFVCEALLGCKKIHRDFIMAHFQSSGLLNQSIVTYRNNFKDLTSNDVNRVDLNGTDAPDHLNRVLEREQLDQLLNGQELLYPYVSANLDPRLDHHQPMPGYSECGVMSQTMPWAIYEQCYYTVVAETLYFDKFFFMSEKVAKPLFAKRLFIIFSSCGYLQNLKQLGFKTFDGIIDESYDTVEDAAVRFKMAFEQLEWLAKQNPEAIAEQIRPIVEHNHAHMFTYRQQVIEQMAKMVHNCIPESLI